MRMNGKIYRTQPSTFVSRTCKRKTENCKKACLSTNALLPTPKLIFSWTAVLWLNGFMMKEWLMNEHHQLTLCISNGNEGAKCQGL